MHQYSLNGEKNFMDYAGMMKDIIVVFNAEKCVRYFVKDIYVFIADIWYANAIICLYCLPVIDPLMMLKMLISTIQAYALMQFVFTSYRF